jgi:hypothetical protein
MIRYAVKPNFVLKVEGKKKYLFVLSKILFRYSKLFNKCNYSK